MAESKEQMHLKVVTPERVLFDANVDELVIDTRAGQLTVLPRHQAMVTILKAGEAIVRSGETEQPLVISGGLLEVALNKVVVLADTAEHVSELDLERAQKAVDLAKQLITDKKFEPHEYESLQANLAKHQARVSAFTKWRK